MTKLPNYPAQSENSGFEQLFSEILSKVLSSDPVKLNVTLFDGSSVKENGAPAESEEKFYSEEDWPSFKDDDLNPVVPNSTIPVSPKVLNSTIWSLPEGVSPLYVLSWMGVALVAIIILSLLACILHHCRGKNSKF